MTLMTILVSAGMYVPKGTDTRPGVKCMPLLLYPYRRAYETDSVRICPTRLTRLRAIARAACELAPHMFGAPKIRQLYRGGGLGGDVQVMLSSHLSGGPQEMPDS